jgi:predicted nucleic acid-binding protein
MVFADTLYWYALANPRDQWHWRVSQARAVLGQVHVVTTEEVLVEFLTAMSGGGPYLRQVGVAIVNDIIADSSVVVVNQSHSSFENGLQLYANRPDKDYSLVDCISMWTMRDRRITEVLTNDNHFAQEGFNVLISKPA